MAKASKIADLAARATAAAESATIHTPTEVAEVAAPEGWSESDVSMNTTASATPSDAPQVLTALASVKASVTYGGLTLDLTKMSPVGIAYLLQYGYSQSLQDSAAGAKKLATEAYNTRHTDAAAFDKLCAEMDQSYDSMAGLGAEEFANAYTAHCRAERSHGIFTDSLGQRVGGGGGPVDPIAKLQKDIAKERLAAACKKAGVKMFTGETLQSRITQLLAGKHFDDIHAEAVRRHSALDMDLSDIL